MNDSLVCRLSSSSPAQVLKWSMGRVEAKSAYSASKLAAMVTEKSSSNTRLCLFNWRLQFLK